MSLVMHRSQSPETPDSPTGSSVSLALLVGLHSIVASQTSDKFAQLQRLKSNTDALTAQNNEQVAEHTKVKVQLARTKRQLKAIEDALAQQNGSNQKPGLAQKQQTLLQEIEKLGAKRDQLFSAINAKQSEKIIAGQQTKIRELEVELLGTSNIRVRKG